MSLAALCFSPLTEIADRIRRREVSPVELVQALLARIDSVDGKLHSFLCVLGEAALEEARAAEAEIRSGAWRGPLHGVPLGIKDILDTRGVRTTCGSRVLRDHVPDRDATVVRRLREAGAVILGKLHLTEFALSGYHPDLPVPVNPWDPSRFPGLSSSGSGVALAAGLCFGALGTDTGGSIRFPAAACGVVGLKPTYGRVSRAGCFALGDSLDHVGPMARRVADVATLLEAMAGFDPEDPTTLDEPSPLCVESLEAGARGVRVGVDEDYVSRDTDPAVRDALHAALRVLEQAGATLVPVHVPPVEELLPDWALLCAPEALVAHAGLFPERAADYGPTYRSFLEYAARLPARDYAAASGRRRVWSGRLREVFRHADVLACPSAPFLPLPVSVLAPHAPFDPSTAPALLRFTGPFDFSGSPTLSVPSGFSAEGLPHSLQLVGPHGSEAMLCRVGHAYQMATSWHERRPPLAA